MTHTVAHGGRRTRYRRPGLVLLMALFAVPAAAGPIDEWQQASQDDTCAAYEAYAAKYPANQLSQLARERAVDRCKPVPPPPPPPIEPPQPPPEPPPAPPLAPPVVAPPAPAPAPSTPSIPSPSADGHGAVVETVATYYAALSRADARTAGGMWFEAPQALRYVRYTEYCNLHRSDVTDFDGNRAVVAVDVTCKSRRERARLYRVNVTLERAGSQWKIRSLKDR
jgi:hypothetical protein